MRVSKSREAWMDGWVDALAYRSNSGVSSLGNARCSMLRIFRWRSLFGCIARGVVGGTAGRCVGDEEGWQYLVGNVGVRGAMLSSSLQQPTWRWSLWSLTGLVPGSSRVFSIKSGVMHWGGPWMPLS